MLNRKMVFPWNIDNPTFEDEWLAVSCIGTCVIKLGEKVMNNERQCDFTFESEPWMFTGEIRAPKYGEYYLPVHSNGVVKCSRTWDEGKRPIVVPVEDMNDYTTDYETQREKIMNDELQVEADIEIDGKGFNYTGEARRVKQGEYYQDRGGQVSRWYPSYPTLARYPILVPVKEWSDLKVEAWNVPEPGLDWGVAGKFSLGRLEHSSSIKIEQINVCYRERA